MINEARVQQVMQQTGMGQVQAFHRVQQEQVLARRPNPFPLGKNNSIDHDAEYAEWAKRNPELAARHA
jgi:predicted DNA-binding transcriptional regulator AlpA